MFFPDFSLSAMGKYIELTRQALQPVGGMHYCPFLLLQAQLPQIVALDLASSDTRCVVSDKVLLQHVKVNDDKVKGLMSQ